MSDERVAPRGPVQYDYPAIEELGERIAEQAAHLDAATHRLLSDIRAFDEQAGWAHQGARTCAQWLSWRLGWGHGTAREHVRVATKLAELPLIDDALRRGEISYCKARAITRVATPSTESTLLDYARYSTGSQLESICRKWHTVLRHDDDTRPKDDQDRRHVRHYDTADGMVKVVAVLHPEEAAMVLAAIERVAIERCRERDAETGLDEASIGVSRQASTSATSADTAAVATSCDATQSCAEVDRAHDAASSPAHVSAETRQPVIASPAPHISTEMRCASDACLTPHVSAEARCVPGAVSPPPHVSANASAALAPHVSPETPDVVMAAPGLSAEDLDASAPAAHVSPEPLDAAAPTPHVRAKTLDATTLAPHVSAETPGTGVSAPDLSPGAVATPVKTLPRAHTSGFDRADALVSIAAAIVRGASKERSPIELAISVSAETLRHRPACPDPGKEGATPDPTAVACFRDGTCISDVAVRRLACDCGVVGVLEDEAGIALSVGRRTRTIPGAMKRALLRRDRTCRYPGCSTRVFLEGHHITHWIDGGDTALSNLLCLCTHHHRYLHEYGFTVRTAENGDVAFFDSRGRPVPAVPEPAKPRPRGFDTIREQNRELHITRDTPALGWDGTPVDHHLVIDGLVRAEERGQVHREVQGERERERA
jgi:hypothetical protein